MIKLRQNIKSRLTFAMAFAFLFYALLFFAAEVHANGNVSADEPVPPANKSVRRAPIKRAAPKALEVLAEVVNEPAAQDLQNVQIMEPEPQLSQTDSLETGIRMVEQGRYKQAHGLLQKAVQEDRGNPYAWYWYGMAHEKVGQYESAQLFYARAVELDPAFPPLSRVLAYPDDEDRKALWDPLRPARVYPIELGDQNMTIVPPDAPDATLRQPVSYVDPVLPQVPVYVPPGVPLYEPSDQVQVMTFDVPPSNQAEDAPVYVPPGFSGSIYKLPEQIQTTSFDVPSSGYAGEAPVYIPPPPPK